MRTLNKNLLTALYVALVLLLNNCSKSEDVVPVFGSPVITGQNAVSINANQSREIVFTDLLVTDEDSTYPTGFTLTVTAGADYTFSANTITPATDFNGTLGVNVFVNDGTTNSNTFSLQVTVNAPLSNELADLPPDTGGTHTAKLRSGSTPYQFGYYEYLPGGYTTNTHDYPLLVFLHGQAERGDGTTITILDKVLTNGPPKLIKAGAWNPTHPMIVISPQFYQIAGDDNVNNWGGGKPAYLKAFIEYLIATYRVNESRIYLTGLSHGGNGVFDYLTGSVDDTQSHLAAAAPVAAYGAGAGFAKCKNTPIWTFVGENDATNFSTTKNFITKYNAQSPAPKYVAKITAYAGKGHDVWTITYNGSGMGQEDAAFSPFNMTLYDWMFQYKRP